MLWWIPALLVPLISGLVAYLDKVGLGKSKTSAFAFIMTLLIALMLSVFIPSVHASLELVSFAYLTSAIGAVALYFVLRAMKSGELSFVSPYLSGINPIILWILSTLLVGDRISGIQLTGIFTIIIGSALLEVEEKVWKRRMLANLKKPLLFATLAATLYATSSTIDRFLMKSGLGVLSYLVLVHWFAVLNLGIILLIRHKRDVVNQIRTALSSDWKVLLAVSILTLTYRGLQIYAVSLGPVSLVISIKKLSTLVTVILAGELLHEKYWKRRLIATAIMITGAIMMVV